MSNEMNQQPRKRGPMGRMGRGMQPGEKPKDLKKSIKQLAQYIGKYKIAIFIVMICAACSTVFNVAGPKILGKATTALSEGLMEKIRGTGSIDFARIGTILLFVLGLYLMSALFSFIQGWIMTGVSMKVTYKLREQTFAKLERLPLSYFDHTTYGEVLSYMTNDIETINQTLNQSLTQIVTSVTTLVGIIVMMFSINWVMTLVTLCILPLSALFISLVVKHSQKYFRAQQTQLGHINGRIEEVYTGHNIVQAFGREEDEFAEFDKYNRQLYGSAFKSQFFSGMMQPIMLFIGNLGYVAVCILGGWMASNGSITVGDIQAFIQYVRQFNQPISQVANMSNIIQMTMAASERVFNFLESPEEVPDAEDALPALENSGAVDFDHIHFGYDADKPVINDFTAHVKPGSKVAIVGPTGAGKSTIIKLLMRFYDIDSGSITVGEHDIRDFKRSDLRRMFGMVLQDTWLYNGTIADNIRYGRLDATDEEVCAAARAAHADHFIRTLPEGYDTVLNEEADNISQGQKQLLTIARAVLADPQVLILDEATSSVDTRTELQIQKAMDRLMEGRTSFIIAHRLSTIKNADNIFVLNHGDIVEQGSHQALLAKGGFYADLYNSQFEVEEELAS
mgnify:CR=1 FL=1